MIIGVVEHGEVRIFDSIDHAIREWAAYPSDVESGVITFYDADGVWLEPRLAGPLTLHRNAAPHAAVDPIGLALFEAETLIPNRYFDSLDELRAWFPFSP